jgi:dimethylaniline monooxygenase (N-oxide forming)
VKRIAVIGAGPSGLVTVKELLDEGHIPVCFERAPDLGGVFRYDERDGVIWRSCRLTSSGVLTAFSDFPVTSTEREHMLAGEYAGYLGRYADAFGLRRYLKFRATVDAVTRTGLGDWIVRISINGGPAIEERFDAVAVCCGLNQTPHVPPVAGRDTFTGLILHGSQYRDAGMTAGRRVLVVGGGESSADIVAEVSPAAAETVLSLRRGVAVVPRRRFGVPYDFTLARLNHSPASWIAQTRHPEDEWKRHIYRALTLPLLPIEWIARAWTAVADGRAPLLRPRLFGDGGDRAAVAARLATRQTVRALLAESGGTVLEQFGTKSEGFAEALANDRCRRAGSLARFIGPLAVFDDGSTFEPDIVVFCTGFENRMPFLDPTCRAAARYLHTFDPAIGGSLAFIGMARPAHGALPPVAELQARWFALIQSGRRLLPSAADMAADTARLIDDRRRHFRAVTGRLEHLVDYTAFCDRLAEEVGCKPTRADLRAETIGLRLRFFASAFVAAQYRLVGPHAKPALARQVIASLPVTHPWPTILALYGRWLSCRVLHWLLGSPFAPKLQL